MSNFDAKKVKEEIVQWIQEWFRDNGRNCNAIVGVSGGIDSSVVTALCVEALGRNRVVGVLMPCGEQKDIKYGYYLCGQLGIRFDEINIKNAVDGVVKSLKSGVTIYPILSSQTMINLPARIRMVTLYAYSQSMNGRVANTSNLSESWVGYDTRYGDSVGDFSPLFNLTKAEIFEIGKELDLPECLLYRTPADGLCSQTDEERWGFSYEVLDKYIRTGECEDEKIKEKIDSMHEKNLFKMLPMPCFTLNNTI